MGKDVYIFYFMKIVRLQVFPHLFYKSQKVIVWWFSPAGRKVVYWFISRHFGWLSNHPKYVSTIFSVSEGSYCCLKDLLPTIMNPVCYFTSNKLFVGVVVHIDSVLVDKLCIYCTVALDIGHWLLLFFKVVFWGFFVTMTVQSDNKRSIKYLSFY